jgi:hypothetical protein
MHLRAHAGLLKAQTRQLHQAIIALNPFLKKAERQGAGLYRTVHSNNGSSGTNGHSSTRMMMQVKVRDSLAGHQDHASLPGSDGQMRNLVSQQNAYNSFGDFLVAFGVFQKRQNWHWQILAQLAKQLGDLYTANVLARNDDIPRRQVELFAAMPQLERNQFGNLEHDVAPDIGLAENLDCVLRHAQSTAKFFHSLREKVEDLPPVSLAEWHRPLLSETTESNRPDSPRPPAATPSVIRRASGS